MKTVYLCNYESIIDENAGLLKMLNSHDAITAIHSINVCALVDQFVRPYCGPKNHYLITTAALLHDIGKICVPASILQKVGTLTAEERQIIEQHPEHGAKILTDEGYSQLVIDAVLQHHMRADRQGYPNIPYMYQGDYAKVIAVADAYEAMTYPRPYKQPISPNEAIQRIIEGAETGQFDRYTAHQFAAYIGCMSKASGC